MNTAAAAFDRTSTFLTCVANAELPAGVFASCTVPFTGVRVADGKTVV